MMNLGVCLLAGKIIKDVIRKEDVAARWGGDEYVILLPNTTNEEAHQLVIDITKKCNEEPSEPVNLSISMGFATKIKFSESMKEIFKQADDMMYKNKSYSSLNTKRNTVNAILNSLHRKIIDEEVHSVRVSKFCIQIGKAMKLREDEIKDIEILGKIHDIGKISIDESILNKPGCLSEDEYDIVRRHSEIGYNIICSLPELSYLANNVLAHHEKWDGTGYPNGLKERNIPLMARILSVADAFEAMTSDKPYRKAFTIDEAANELKNCSGTQFDPQVVNSFLKII